MHIPRFTKNSLATLPSDESFWSADALLPEEAPKAHEPVVFASLGGYKVEFPSSTTRAKELSVSTRNKENATSIDDRAVRRARRQVAVCGGDLSNATILRASVKQEPGRRPDSVYLATGPTTLKRKNARRDGMVFSSCIANIVSRELSVVGEASDEESDEESVYSQESWDGAVEALAA